MQKIISEIIVYQKINKYHWNDKYNYKRKIDMKAKN